MQHGTSRTPCDIAAQGVGAPEPPELIFAFRSVRPASALHPAESDMQLMRRHMHAEREAFRRVRPRWATGRVGPSASRTQRFRMRRNGHTHTLGTRSTHTGPLPSVCGHTL